MALDWKKTSEWWYARYTVNGKTKLVNLGVKIEGHRPESINGRGNEAFRRSRDRAKIKHDESLAAIREKRNLQHLTERMIELKTGEAMKDFAVTDLIQGWERMPKKKSREELHPRYVDAVHATLRRFVDFIQAKHSNIRDVSQVGRAVAWEFIASEESRGLSAKTRNDSLKRLRAVFRSLQNENCVTLNPFDGIPLHTENHVHRRPLTPEEIAKVLKAVEDDDFARPLIVCALSTAMRKGDCCCLKWTDVHLDAKDAAGRPLLDHITVKTSKTGDTVPAPVDRRLKAELVRAKPNADGQNPYVWPRQATMYAENQQGVTWRIRQAFERAGLGDEETHVKRKRGMRRASILDFHSLRTTWITEKLMAGVPIEAVKRTSGHRTTDVVTEHYFRPSDQQHLEALINGGSTGA